MSTEIKLASKSTRTPKKGRRSQPRPTKCRLNEMHYETRWQYAASINSNGSGLLTLADISPSIANTVEYSNITALFGLVRLVSCEVEFGPTCTSTAGIGTMIVGTQMQANQNSHATTPLSASQVENLDNKQEYVIGATQMRVYKYKMKVPAQLEFSSITSDAPATVTPWAGSPGCVYVYAPGLTASAPYLTIYVKVRYHLKGRV